MSGHSIDTKHASQFFAMLLKTSLDAGSAGMTNVHFA